MFSGHFAHPLQIAMPFLDGHIQAHQIRESEARAAAQILGIAELHFLRQPDWFLADFVQPTADGLAEILRRENPQLIYLPHPNDDHPDHRAALDILRATNHHADFVRTYELWTPLSSFDHVRLR